MVDSFFYKKIGQATWKIFSYLVLLPQNISPDNKPAGSASFNIDILDVHKKPQTIKIFTFPWSSYSYSQMMIW